MTIPMFILMQVTAALFGLCLGVSLLCFSYAMSGGHRGYWAGTACGLTATVLAAGTWWAIFVRYTTGI